MAMTSMIFKKAIQAARSAVAIGALATVAMGCAWAQPAPSVSAKAWAALDETGKMVGGYKADEAMPIASITKLMMAMAYLDKSPDMSLSERIDERDIDTLKNSSSRLPVGAVIVRSDLMRLALASSENRAASALARGYPGGTVAMVEAMNKKAKELGLSSAHFVDPTGLSPSNVASARDVARMAIAARAYKEALSAATQSEYKQWVAMPEAGAPLELGYKNTNKMLRDGLLAPLISKTGYIKEAGRCLTWALSKAEGTVVGLAVLGAPSFVSRDADELRLSAWARGEPEPVIQTAALVKVGSRLKGPKRSKRRHA
jgi:D-alanyl-D-alanine endopeptidase (penicillin-binding protein 7)